MSVVKIKKVKDISDYYKKYNGQCVRQDSVIEFNPYTNEMTARFNPELYGLPIEVENGEVYWFSFEPNIMPETVNKMMLELVPHMKRLLGEDEEYVDIGSIIEDIEFLICRYCSNKIH